MIAISAIGQDSHRFAGSRPLILGGVRIPDVRGLEGNSDADVVLHALTNALSGLSGVRILGEEADRMCRAGITDSRAYVRAALDTLGDIRLVHLSFTIEAAKPRLSDHIERMRESIASLTGLPVGRVAMTATSGEGLTAFGRGEGMSCFCLASALIPD